MSSKDKQIQQLQQGKLHDPFELLGVHADKKGSVLRAFMPTAESVSLQDFGAMERLQGTDLFEFHLDRSQASALPQHYALQWKEKGSGQVHQLISPYSFAPQISDLDMHWFAEGRHHHAYRFLGARMINVDGISGCQFAVWAPGVKRVSVVGSFNGWHGLRHLMRSRGSSGIWELFIPGLSSGDFYQYEILSDKDQLLTKIDPYAQQMTLRPSIDCVVPEDDQFEWQDGPWLEQRRNWDWQREPMSIYELHLGSWHGNEHGGFINYRDIALQLVDYVKTLGYTHIELLPVMEHPLDQSWGYQVTGFFAPTARFGTAEDFRFLVDLCHQNDIGVLLDWVPGHFPKDQHALAYFTGRATYEHADPKRGEHKDWGTLIFDYGRKEVKNFLVSNAIYWLEEFHIDGLRVDAVASMLYLDYSREEGEWEPNEFGGRENLEAVAFIKDLNEVVHERFPGALTMAEESTSWPQVSRPVYAGGLGFSMKWNMGWMNDTLEYIESEPVHRKFHQDKLTFSQLYAYSENFILPFSHDEVVHLKRSMLGKMPGDEWQKRANLRLLYAWQYAHPGKKLLFMGGEFGQWNEWDSQSPLDWSLASAPGHQGLQHLLADLNQLYRQRSALYQRDFSEDGFQWIDCEDRGQSVLSFIRWSDDEHVVCVFNFTPVPRHSYLIGVPESGDYSEILNTDSDYYGGSNQGNEGVLHATPESRNGMPASVALTLPPLSALMLRKQS